MPLRVGFLGPAGTFGEQAALTYAPGAYHVALPTNGAVVAAVQEGKVDEGIAPVENSLEGSINETVDVLLQSESVFIRGEIVLPIEHHLIAAPGTRMEDIEVVMSHPAALAQCRVFLDQHLPGVQLEAGLSTAAAVASAVGRPGAAGIGGRRAAEVAQGEIIRESIQDVAHNKTRFLILGREDAPRQGDDKTSIAFTVAHDRPGTLLGVLSELASRGINMTRIESRPSREELGIYVFLIDFQGHHDDPVVAETLAAVRERAHYFRLLGSYPRSVS